MQMCKRAVVAALMMSWLLVLNGYGQQDKKGTIDLRDKDLAAKKLVSLSGDWEFYYNQLLEPGDLKDRQPEQYIKVPGSWHRLANFPVLGYATYRCKVLLPHDQKSLLLYIPAANSASKIWINGEIRGKTGVVARSRDNYEARLSTVYVSVPEKVDELEIVIQVANFSYFSAGLVSSPKIGLSAVVIGQKSRANGIENFFAGSLVAMFVYQIILYFLYNRGKPNLWLALICLGVALRSMILHGGSFLLPNLFPEVPFEVWEKIEFGSVYLITAVFPLYIYHLFESSSRKIITGFVVLGLALAVPVLFTPQYIYGLLLEGCHIGLILAFIYAIITVGKAWRNGNTDARIIFFGVIASFPFILLEILQNSALTHLNINFEYLVELGVLVFLLFQVYILARHYANSYKSLEVINKELEVVIAQRTSELVQSNSIKDRLLSVISHDVKSPLNSLQSLISLYNGNNLTREEFDQFVRQVEGDLGTTNGLVENILYWTASQRKGEGVKSEKINIRQLVEENVKLAEAIARNKSLNIRYEVPDIDLVTDRGILHFTLRNLLANAIKFSHRNGHIEIMGERVEGGFRLKVVDHGIGMSPAQIEALFATERAHSTQGTLAERGTGLGLSLCREYLQKVQGDLSVVSHEGEGSAFEVYIPQK